MNTYKEMDHSIRNAESRDPNTPNRNPKSGPHVTEPEERAFGKLMVVVEDLFFLAKIREVTKRFHIDLEAVRPEQVVERLAEPGYSLVVLDLNHRSGRAIEVLDLIKKNPLTRNVSVLGFLSHVQGDLAAAARAAACDTVIARSALSQRLAEILSGYRKA
jgi:CheY-like chemotaxis protein